jgi:hypothetical protein
MASTTKIKAISNVGFTANITVGNIYEILATTDTQFSIIDDLTNTVLVPKSLFKMHYEISALNLLLSSTVGGTDGSEGLDSFGNKFKLVSADSENLRVNVQDKTTTLTVLIPFLDSYGGVDFALSLLEQYGFSIVYSQDVSKQFSDRDDFINSFVVPNGYKYNETSTGIITITDSTNIQIIPNLIGLKLNFA